MGLFDNLSTKKTQNQEIDGYLVWKFGMKPEEVRDAGYGPYHDVRSTSGLETNNGVFLNKPATISFNFNQGKLRRIQIWGYVGQNKALAASSFANIYDYLKTQGELESAGLRLEQFSTPVDLAEMLLKMMNAPADKDRTRKVQIKLKDVSPENVTVFASLIDHPSEGYFVFLYFDQKV